MKKGWLVLVLVTVSFLCIFTGIFIGRNTGKRHAHILYDTNIPTAEASAYHDGKININTANVSDLVQLPGIGEGIAQKIVAYRKEHGPFSNIEQLLNVSGIGPSRLESIDDYITVGG